jgi:Family of unknown function (DUF6370)
MKLTALFFCSAMAFSFAPNAAVAGDKHAHDKHAAKAEAPKAAAKADAKEVSLTGMMVCGKCNLKETTECQDVLKVTEGKTEVKYYLDDNAVAKENHGPVCGGSKKATVKGVVGEKDKKKTLTASAIAYE